MPYRFEEAIHVAQARAPPPLIALPSPPPPLLGAPWAKNSRRPRHAAAGCNAQAPPAAAAPPGFVVRFFWIEGPPGAAKLEPADARGPADQAAREDGNGTGILEAASSAPRGGHADMYCGFDPLGSLRRCLKRGCRPAGSRRRAGNIRHALVGIATNRQQTLSARVSCCGRTPPPRGCEPGAAGWRG